MRAAGVADSEKLEKHETAPLVLRPFTCRPKARREPIVPGMARAEKFFIVSGGKRLEIGTGVAAMMSVRAVASPLAKPGNQVFWTWLRATQETLSAKSWAAGQSAGDAICLKKTEEVMMKGLNEKISKMDFSFFGSGQHGMSVEGMQKNLENNHVLFLDVRTNEEVDHVSFPFAKHIPLNELPDRINEVPKDKLIVAFCASVFRGAIAYTYLLSQGFEEVKALTANIEDMVKVFKPGPLYKS